MNELEEIIDKIKESPQRSKKKLGKKGKIIISVVSVIAILIGAILYVTLTAPLSEKYWKPHEGFTMPNVDWRSIKDSYLLERGKNDIDPLNKRIGNFVEDDKFIVYLYVDLKSYEAHSDGTGALWIHPYVYAERTGKTTYRIKELVFQISYEDGKNESNVFLESSESRIKNLYFPYDMNYYKIEGVNKDAKDIKDCGFEIPMKLYFFDEYPNWINYTITFTATLYYGKYVEGWIGSGWQDVHKLSTSVEIYIVPEGGE